MKQRLLTEDKLPQKLPVLYSEYITNQIEVILNYNQDNTTGLSAWKDYIDGISSHISNRAIAFGYGNNYKRDSDEFVLLHDFGATFRLIDGTDRTFVEIVWIDLKPEEFGLEVPPMLNENVRNNDSVKKIQSLIERIENL